MSHSWKCATCGESHADIPMSFAADFPDMYANMKTAERETRALISSDQCVIDQKWFFIRGCLEIPIAGCDEVFLWGLWASVREEVFDEIDECWNLKRREKTHGPFKGRLNNSLSEYPETLNLKLEITLQPVGTRPLLRVEETSHPLGAEQRDGISRERAMALVASILHKAT